MPYSVCKKFSRVIILTDTVSCQYDEIYKKFRIICIKYLNVTSSRIISPVPQILYKKHIEK